MIGYGFLSLYLVSFTIRLYTSGSKATKLNAS